MFAKIIAIFALAYAAPASDLFPTDAKMGTPIPNQFIVVYKNEETTGASYLNKLRVAGFDVAPEAALIHDYELPGFKASAIKLPESFAPADIQSLITDDVAYIEQDQYVSALGSQSGAPWGLNRISSRNNVAAGASYTFPDSAGAGIDAYIVDTGVLTTHPDFEGRATFGADFSGSGPGDGNGHGTHVAGTIGSKTYGVAKKANLIAVRVLNSQGSGSLSNVIAGVNWAAKKAAAQGQKIKSVANLSLGGGASTAVDDAIAGATRSGLVVAVAAGNSAGDACKLSPARAPTAITVAASDINDRLASFSEKGSCVDIIAPGVNVLSTWSDGKTRSISGTSMAAPHVAGVIALALAEAQYTTVAAVHDYIKAVGTPGKISGNLSGAPNSLVYNQVEKGLIPQ